MSLIYTSRVGSSIFLSVTTEFSVHEPELRRSNMLIVSAISALFFKLIADPILIRGAKTMGKNGDWVITELFCSFDKVSVMHRYITIISRLITMNSI